MTTLHVTNGDSTAISLRETGRDVLPWRDALHEGPVPDGTRRELLATRAAFLAACGYGDPDRILAGFEARDRKVLDADDVVLWFEHDLYDQLQLVDVLSLLGRPVEAIVVDRYLGELSPAELDELWPRRREVAPVPEVWDAIRAPTPEALAGCAARDFPGFPFLAPALRRFLQELPAPGDGLSRTERLALEAISGGARTREEAFLASQRHDEPRFLGDTWFFRTLDQLAGLIDGDLRLTPLGEQVLAGEADRVEAIPLDRWVGGTHVTRESVWRQPFS